MIFNGRIIRSFSTTKTRKYFDSSLKAVHISNSRKFLKVGSDYDYLFNEVGKQIVDRLLDIKRDFGDIAVVNSRTTHLQHLLNTDDNKNMLKFENFTNKNVNDIVEEDGSKHDLVLSNLSLHWENELPIAFKKINHILKPDGAFIGAIFCEDTLFELRSSLMIAEQERENGISVRTSPLVKAGDICSLLNSSDFTLATVDVLNIDIQYEDIFHLADHLSKMGESNAAMSKRFGMKKDTLLSAASIYQELFNSKEYEDEITTTFQIGFFIGWKKHESQQQPKGRGSGKVNLNILSNRGSKLE